MSFPILIVTQMTNPFPHLLSVGPSLDGHDQVSVAGKPLFFTSISPILDWSTQSAPRTEETWGSTNKSSQSGAGLGLLRHNCAQKQNLRNKGENKLIIKGIMHVLFHFTIPGCGRCQTILRGQFRDTVFGRATKCQFLPSYFGFCDKLVTCRSSHAEREKHIYSGPGPWL